MSDKRDAVIAAYARFAKASQEFCEGYLAELIKLRKELEEIRRGNINSYPPVASPARKREFDD